MSNKTSVLPIGRQNSKVKNDLEIHFSAHSFSLFLEKIIFGGILFILALPLLGDYGNILFPLGRDIIFKITVEFLLLLYFALIFLKYIKSRYTKYDIRNTQSLSNSITISILLFWLIMVIATIFSTQQDFSIWGNIYKNQGLVTWTHYLLFFFLIISFLKSKEQWKFLIYAVILVGSIVSAVAIWQVWSNDLVNRAASTLNNSNYLAAYLVLLMPMTLALFIKKLFNNAQRKYSYLLCGAFLLQFIALILTQTRGGYLGVAVALFTFTFLYLHFSQIRNTKYEILKRLSPLYIFIILAILYSLIIFTPTGQSFQEKLPDFTNRFLNYQNIKSSSGPRLEAWQTGWKGMIERPLLGYGPENFFVAFDEFYSGSQDHTGSLAKDGSLWESWFDKAHNFIFDIGATTGFLGLFAYIGIFASAIWVLLRKLKMWKDSPSTSILCIGLIAAFVGYLSQNLLGFDTTVPGLYLMFLLAYSNFISGSHNEKDAKISNQAQIIKTQKAKFLTFGFWRLLGIWIFIFVIFIASFNLHINIFKANYNLNFAESLAQKGQIDQAFATYEKGLQYNSPSINPNLRRRYAVIALAYYDAVEKHCLPSGDLPQRNNCEKLYKDSKKYLNRALVLQQENAATEWPRFTRNYIYAAQISHILGDYKASDVFFGKALVLSPNRASIYVEWSRLLGERNEIQKAEEKLKKAQSINLRIRING